MLADDVGLRVLMASVASIGRVILGMTHLTRRLFTLVAVIQRELVFEQTGWSPRASRVTRGAINPKLPTMHLRFGMTARTVARRAAKTMVDVTIDARGLRVFPGERKDRRVIESFHAIRAIVTRETRIAHRAAMIRHEGRVLARMTIRAGCQHGLRIRFVCLGRKRVAGTTGQHGSAVIALMTRERETELVVRKTRQRRVRQIGFASLMLGMTRGTILRITQCTVQSIRGRQLIAHGGVTLDTARRVGSAKRRVAQIATRFEISVRSETSNWWMVLKILRAQGTSIERRAAGNDGDADETNEQCECSATTQKPTGRFHDVVLDAKCSITSRTPLRSIIGERERCGERSLQSKSFEEQCGNDVDERRSEQCRAERHVHHAPHTHQAMHQTERRDLAFELAAAAQ